MTKNFLLLILFFSFSHSAFSQTIAELVSKADKLAQQGKTEEIIKLLEPELKDLLIKGESSEALALGFLHLSNAYSQKWDFKKAEYYSLQSTKIGKAISSDTAYYKGMEFLLTLVDFREDIDSIMLLCNQIIDDKRSPDLLRSNALLTLGGHYSGLEMIDSAIYFTTQATTIDSINQDSSSLPYSFFDLGSYYIADNRYEEGLEKILYGRKFIRKQDEFKNASFDIGFADVYYKIGNITKTIELTEKALVYGKNNDLHRLTTQAYTLLGDCAYNYSEWEKAISYYEKADSVNSIRLNKVHRRDIAKIGIANAKINLGRNLSQAELTELQKYREEAPTEILRNRYEFLFLRLEDNSITEFEEKFNTLLANSEDRNADRLKVPLFRLKKEFYTKKGAYQKALEVDRELRIVEKNIEQSNNDYIIQDLQEKYNKDIQDREIKYLDEQNSIKSKIVAQQRNTIIGGVIVLIIGAILMMMLLRLYRKVNKQKNIISKALADKDLLIKEIHHRVKNNLQLVSSLLTLQSRDIDDVKAKAAIQEGKSRVRSMALIHQDLYQKEELKDINVKEYLEKLTKDLFMTYKIDNQLVDLKLDIEDIDLDVDTIVPLGLIINEMITNSLKYAFKENTQGILKVSLKTEGKDLKLNISDDGIGFEEDNIRDDSFGTTMINALTRQLKGNLTIDSTNGTSSTLVFPNK